MKTLLLMRHAKSSWTDATLVDHQRPLNARGSEAAPLMAHWLAEHGPVPQLILSSTAVRARDTAAAILEAFDPEPPLLLEAALYHAEPMALMARVRALDGCIDCAMLVGHNPGMEELLAGLLGRPQRFTTANIAWLEFDGPGWSGLGLPGTVTTCRALWRPRELPGDFLQA